MSEMEKTGRLMQLLHELSSRNGLSVTRPLSPDGPRGSWDGSVTTGTTSVAINDEPSTPSGSPPKTYAHTIPSRCIVTNIPRYSQQQNLLESPVFLTPPPKSPLRQAQQNNIAYWRSPAQWNSKDKGNVVHSTFTTTKTLEIFPDPPKASLEPSLLQLDLSNMATTSPAVALRRMRLLWSKDLNIEYETERQQWMLSMLQNIHRDTKRALRDARLEYDFDCEQQTTLVLYESAGNIEMSLLSWHLG